MDINGIAIHFEGDPHVAATRAVEFLAHFYTPGRNEPERQHHDSEGQEPSAATAPTAQAQAQPDADTLIVNTPAGQQRAPGDRAIGWQWDASIH